MKKYNKLIGNINRYVRDSGIAIMTAVTAAKCISVTALAHSRSMNAASIRTMAQMNEWIIWHVAHCDATIVLKTHNNDDSFGSFLSFGPHKNWFMKTQSIKMNVSVNSMFMCVVHIHNTSRRQAETGKRSCSYMNFINNELDMSTCELSLMWVIVAAVGKTNAVVASIHHQHQIQLYASRRSTYFTQF